MTCRRPCLMRTARRRLRRKVRGRIMPPRPKPSRVLLKLSGEALLGNLPFGIDDSALTRFADGNRRCRPLRHADRRRDRRRQPLPRRGDLRQGRRPGDRRPHGHAGDRHERAGARGGAVAPGNGGARAFGDRDAVDLRDLRASPRGLAHEPRGHRRARRRHRKPVLHHRQRRRAPRAGARMRRAPQGHAGRRRLFRRSAHATRTPSATITSPSRRRSREGLRSWIRPPLRLPATTDCR